MRAAIAIIVTIAVTAGASWAVDAPAVPRFEHVVLIVFENKERSSVIGSRDAPTFNAMAKRYAQLTRYYAVAHPSLPNYLALISGSTHGVRTDCTTCKFRAKTLATTLLPERTWKVYAEGLPEIGFTGAGHDRYAKKHVPFLYFSGVDARRVVPLTKLGADIAEGAFPSFAMIVPDLCHSMHDCSVRTGDAWLRQQLPPLLKLPKTVIFITFDEASAGDRRFGGGSVPALALGTAVRPHATYSRVATHYALLRTIEDAWGLPRLGRTATATPITGIWR